MGYVKRISWIFVVRFQKSGYCEIMDTSASGRNYDKLWANTIVLWKIAKQYTEQDT